MGLPGSFTYLIPRMTVFPRGFFPGKTTPVACRWGREYTNATSVLQRVSSLCMRTELTERAARFVWGQPKPRRKAGGARTRLNRHVGGGPSSDDALGAKRECRTFCNRAEGRWQRPENRIGASSDSQGVRSRWFITHWIASPLLCVRSFSSPSPRCRPRRRDPDRCATSSER